MHKRDAREKQTRTFAWAAGLVALSAVMYCSWPLGFWLNPAAMRSGLASELGAAHQPYAWLFIWLDIVSGGLLVIASITLVRLYRMKGWDLTTLLLLAVYGVCGGLDAALPEKCLPSQQICGPVLADPTLILHGFFDLFGSTALFFCLLTAARYVHLHNRQWLPWIYTIGVASTLFAVLSGVFYIWGGPGYWAQRYYLTLSCIWVASIPFVLRPKRAKL